MDNSPAKLPPGWREFTECNGPSGIDPDGGRWVKRYVRDEVRIVADCNPEADMAKYKDENALDTAWMIHENEKVPVEPQEPEPAPEIFDPPSVKHSCDYHSRPDRGCRECWSVLHQNNDTYFCHGERMGMNLRETLEFIGMFHGPQWRAWRKARNEAKK